MWTLRALLGWRIDNAQTSLSPVYDEQKIISGVVNFQHATKARATASPYHFSLGLLSLCSLECADLDSP